MERRVKPAEWRYFAFSIQRIQSVHFVCLSSVKYANYSPLIYSSSCSPRRLWACSVWWACPATARTRCSTTSKRTMDPSDTSGKRPRSRASTSTLGTSDPVPQPGFNGRTTTCKPRARWAISRLFKIISRAHTYGTQRRQAQTREYSKLLFFPHL